MHQTSVAEGRQTASFGDEPLPADLARELATVDPSGYGPLARRLRQAEPGFDVSVAFVSNYTIAPLPDYVVVHAAREGIVVQPLVTPFDQHVQAVLAPESSLRDRPLDILFLALSMRRLRPDAWGGLSAMTGSEREELRDDVLGHLDQWLAATAEWHPGVTLVSNFVVPVHPGAGVADSRDPYGEMEFYADLNLRLLRRVREVPRARLFDLDRVTAGFGKRRSHDPRLFHLAKMEWSREVLPAVADELVRHLVATLGRARKCLVLDLDNTLWGGVSGEDGPAGVHVGRGDPVGEAFLAFQQRIKALQARGILLAICSKNNPDDVRAVFEERTQDMVLRLQDFAEVAINWDSKVENLRRISKSLNIGLESLVFVDDNPAEVAMVEGALPAVRTLLLTGDPSSFVARLDDLLLFEKAVVLEDDRHKTRQYRENRERESHRQELGDVRTYLTSLGIRLEIRRAREADLPRLEQLFTKTNQFNLTTRRHRAPELERFIRRADSELWLFRSEDRFGDLGIIGAFVLERDGGDLVLESFLMSCRAMGRGIEVAVLNHVKERARQEAGVDGVRADYIPTHRNVPIRDFLGEQGFTETGEEAGARIFRLARGSLAPRPCDWIEVVQ